MQPTLIKSSLVSFLLSIAFLPVCSAAPTLYSPGHFIPVNTVTREPLLLSGEISKGLNRVTGLSQDNEWIRTGAETDRKGNRHIRYNQQFAGIPVSGGNLVVHTGSDASEPARITGTVARMVVADLNEVEIARSLPVAEFISAASVSAEIINGKGNWNWIPNEGKAGFHLAYVGYFFPSGSLERHRVIIPAASRNAVSVEKMICLADVTGSAHTSYHGTREIPCHADSGMYYLKTVSRGKGIETRNLNHRLDYLQVTSYTDADNIWDAAQPGAGNHATDAHFCATGYYDFLLNRFGRNSLDNKGYKLLSYLNYGQQFANAFWNGNAVVYGSGSNGTGPMTTLDIAGHEFTHGLIQETAGLHYASEPGTINESISDMLGAALEYDLDPARFNWLIGEQSGTALRSMSDPEFRNQPSCYHGPNWYFGSGDQGGVHINSGFLNRWFYLLSEGDTGVNALGQPYAVSGTGIHEAMNIVYHTLVNYLVPMSGFADFREFTLLSAADLFGNCSPQYASVADAWSAVGYADPFHAGTPVLTASSGTALCAGDSVLLETPAYPGATYSWYLNGQNAYTGTKNKMYVRNSGSWNVLVSQCGKHHFTNELAVSTYQNPAVTTLPVTVCEGQPAILSGWPAGGTFSVPNPYSGPSVAFTYIFTDTLGCTGSAQAFITVKTLPEVHILNETTAFPENAEPVLLESDIPGIFSGYAVSGGYFHPELAGTGGPYEVTVTHTDATGCTATGTKLFEVLKPCNRDFAAAVLTSSSTELVPGAAVRLRVDASSDDFKFTWVLPDGCMAIGSLTNQEIDVIWGNESGTVLLRLENSCGERHESGLRISVSEKTPAPGFRLYPNPASDYAQIELPGSDVPEHIEIRVMDAGGRVVATQLATQRIFRINTSGLAPGLYAVEISGVHDRIRSRFIVR